MTDSLIEKIRALVKPVSSADPTLVIHAHEFEDIIRQHQTAAPDVERVARAILNSCEYARLESWRETEYRNHKIYWDDVAKEAIAAMNMGDASAHIDHINGDRLDNRRSNLRVCTQMQNSQNVRVVTAKNPFIGSCLHKPTGKWQAQIRLWGKITYLGLHDTREAASEAYKNAARKYRGEFSNVD